MDSERAAFIRAICENPSDDLPRLLFADRLEERGESERAEFIRVQCELEGRLKLPTDLSRGCWCKLPTCRVCTTVMPLIFSSSNTLDKFAHDWIGPAADKGIEAWTGYGECLLLNPASMDRRLATGLTFRRGFISEIRCTLAQFVGGICPTCADDESFCEACNQTGRTPGIVAKVFEEMPVERVVLTDREPYHTEGTRHVRGGYHWTWFTNYSDAGQVPSSFALPREIMQHLTTATHRGIAQSYESVELAKAALSTACVAYGRSLANLPPLK